MLKTVKKIALGAALLLAASLSHAATTRYSEIRATLQPNTTSQGVFLGTGTIQNFNCSTCTVYNQLNYGVGGTTVNATGFLNDGSTKTLSGNNTFSATSTTSVNGPLGFNGVFPSSGSYPISQGPGLPPKWTSFGRIAQIQSYTVGATSSTSVTTFVPSNLTGAITPTSSTSKILVMCQSTIRNTTSNKISYAAVARNGSILDDSTNGGVQFYTTTGGDATSPFFIMFYDAPATTSSTTYTIYFKTDAAGAAILGAGVVLSKVFLVEIQQ